uniref:Uncharacterized protein n=1 Tax=Knipowitschia caucasica TaxID=637954 RepID=A0AAV2K3R2_KNICA
MTDGELLKNIDSLLFQCALQTREVSQKKNEINQQIEVYRNYIAKAKSTIETTKTSIKSLEEEIKTKQNTLAQNEAVSKSMKTTSTLVLHYDQTLRTELENRRAMYNRDKEEYEKRIASYKSTLQSYKEYYYKNPLAQKLLGLQAENREIETNIKCYDDLLALKQSELDNLTVVNTSSPEKSLESEKLENELETEPAEDASPVSPQSEEHPILAEKASGGHVEEEQSASTACLPAELTATMDSQQMDEHQEEAETGISETGPHSPALLLLQEKNAAQENQEIELAMEFEMDEGPEEEQAANQEEDETMTSLSQTSSQGANQTNTSPTRTKPDPATPTFPFTPSQSPQISDTSKSPAFPFNIHSEPSTPGFFGFGAQDEDPASPFSSSFFEEKKTAESKSSMEFLFNQPEPSEDFQFAFNTKSPESGGRSKDKAKGDFPFSFNF